MTEQLKDIAGAGGGGGGCFRAGTLVMRVGGNTTPIESLFEGDEILAFDEHGVIHSAKITKVHRHDTKEPILRVKFWRGEIYITPNHWVLNQYNAFVEMGSLTTHDALVDGMGHLRPIISAELVGHEPVYNLTVEPHHTFIADDVRVHNGGHRARFPEIAGAGGGEGGGGKGGGGTARTIVEDADSLRSKAYVSILDLIGEGEIGGLVDGGRSIFLDDTPLINSVGQANFTGVSWETRYGTQAQSPIPGFEQASSPYSVGTALLAGIPQTVTISNPNSDFVRVIVSVGSLISQDVTTGDIHGTAVSYQIEVSADGSGYETTSYTISGKTRSKYQRSHLVKLPKPGSSWQVRVTRTTSDSTSSALTNLTFFDSYESIVDSKLSYPNSAIVGVRIDSAQFSSIPTRSYLIDGLFIRVPTNYDPVAGTYSGIWNGSFKLAVSSNPAWILYDLLTDERYGLGQFVPTSAVDKTTLYTIGRYCDDLVGDGLGGTERRFTLNTAIQSQAEAYRVVSDICSVFRGMAYWNGSQVGFTQDSPTDPTMIYSPSNVVDGLFTYTGSSRKDRHSVVHVTWNDASDKYRHKIEYIEDPELIAKYGIRKLELVAFGCSSRGQANRVGRWVLYTEKYESDFISFKVGMDSARVVPGNIIRLHDPIRAGKRMAGRLVSCTTTTATLDAPVTLAGSGAQISIRMPDGTFTDRDIVETGGVVSTVSWSGVLPELPVGNAMFIIAETNLQPILARVVGIAQEGAEGTQSSITCLEHNPTKYDLIDFGHFLGIANTSIINTAVAEPTQYQAVESQYLIAPGVLGTKVTVSWFGVAPSFELRWRQTGAAITNWNSRVLSTTSFDIIDVSAAGMEFELTAFNSFSRSRTVTFGMVIVGKTTNPNPPSAFYAIGQPMQISLGWTYGSMAQDTECIEIWSNTINNESSASRIASLPWPQDKFTDTGKGIDVHLYYFARVKDKSGNFSTWVTADATTIKDPSLLLAQLNKELGLDQIKDDLAIPLAAIQTLDMTALANASKSAENNAKSIINDILTGEKTSQALLGNVAPRLAVAEKTITKNVTDLAAESSSREALAVRVDQNEAAVITEANARATDTLAMSNQITALSSTVNNTVTASILAESTTRATQIDSMAQQLSALSASVGPNISAQVSSESAARASADTALGTRVDSLTSTVGANNATASSAITALVAVDSALTTRVSSLEVNVGTGVAAAIATEASARATADTANAALINAVSVRLNSGDFATIKTQSEAAVNSLGALSATYTIKAQANGTYAAMQLGAAPGTVGSYVTFTTDKFAIAKPDGTGTKYIFTVGTLNGVSTVGIDGNLIVDGSIAGRSLSLTGGLSALSSNIGTMTSGKLQSADGKFVIDLNLKFISITV